MQRRYNQDLPYFADEIAGEPDEAALSAAVRSFADNPEAINRFIRQGDLEAPAVQSFIKAMSLSMSTGARGRVFVGIGSDADISLSSSDLFIKATADPSIAARDARDSGRRSIVLDIATPPSLPMAAISHDDMAFVIPPMTNWRLVEKRSGVTMRLPRDSVRRVGMAEEVRIDEYYVIEAVPANRWSPRSAPSDVMDDGSSVWVKPWQWDSSNDDVRRQYEAAADSTPGASQAVRDYTASPLNVNRPARRSMLRSSGRFWPDR